MAGTYSTYSRLDNSKALLANKPTISAGKIWEEFAEESHGILSAYVSKKLNTNAEQVLSEELTLNKGIIVLDAGCGSGRWSFFFAPLVKKVFGIDSSKKVIQNARRANKYSNAQFKFAEITKLPFKTNTFDLTYTCITLQHIVSENDFKKAVSELVRVTKKSGRIAIFETVSQIKETRSNYIAIRSSKEYRNIFENSGAKFLYERGIRFPYFYYAYLELLKKIFAFKPQYKDVRDTIIFFKKLEKSSFAGLIKAGFSFIFLISVPFNFLSRYLTFLSAERLIIFSKK